MVVDENADSFGLVYHHPTTNRVAAFERIGEGKGRQSLDPRGRAAGRGRRINKPSSPTIVSVCADSENWCVGV